MRWFITVTTLFAACAIYATWLRPWMRTTAWGQRFLERIEPIERMLWWKSETIFMARVKMVAGALYTMGTQLGAIDITPLLPFIPDQYEGLILFVWNLLPLTLTVLGWLDQRQRFDTTKPVEMVAMRTDAPPDLQEEVARLEARLGEIRGEIRRSEAV